MHYKNGREAKNGDKVVLMTACAWDQAGKPTQHRMTTGVLYDAVAGNDHCNGRIALAHASDPMPDLKECLHVDDVIKALPATVPDTSKAG